MTRVFNFSPALLRRERKGTTRLDKKTSRAKKFPTRRKKQCFGKTPDVFLPLAQSNNKPLPNFFDRATTCNERANPTTYCCRANKRRPQSFGADGSRRTASTGTVQQWRKAIQSRVDRLRRLGAHSGAGQFCGAGDGDEAPNLRSQRAYKSWYSPSSEYFQRTTTDRQGERVYFI